mgnify:CR=1 FL=1|nr:hypothetical protein [uncultured Romboutsia sp.]
MIKYIIKRKVKNEMLENSKKIVFYTGVAAVSTLGVYISYRAIKKMRSRKEDEIEYLEYEEFDLGDMKNELEKDELKEKVDEFNSRRICCENCEDASPEEIKKHIDSIKDDKENIEIDTEEYESEEYENYEDDIEK